MKTLEEVLAAVERVTGEKPRGSARYGWAAICPAHQDTNPSLSIGRGKVAPFVLYCHAGCCFGDIMHALGFQPHVNPPGASQKDVWLAWTSEEEGALDALEVETRRQDLSERGDWRVAYERAVASKEARAIWSQALFGSRYKDSEWLVGRFRLGFMDDYFVPNGNGGVLSPALTIPYWGRRESLLTVQYRLLLPECPGGKYRFAKGLPTELYLVEPDKPVGGQALVVEGAKKAIVTWLQVGRHFDHVVGLPSKQPRRALITSLDAFDSIVLALDPDAHVESKRGASAIDNIASLVDTRRYRYVSLPAKPDDFFTELGFGEKEFMQLVNDARKLGSVS